MEGQSMLNLYDGSSGNFLDEVANPGGGAMMPPDGAHNMGLGGDAMMQGGMDQGMNPGMQQDMMMMAQQPAVQQNYTSLHNPMQHTQKLHHYNSYGATDQFAGGGATVGMPGQELMSSPHPSQQPFGSPPPGGSQLQSPPQQNFTQYTLQSSPRLTPPRQPTPQPQQMSISQNSMTWRASPGPAQQNMPPGSPYSHNGLSQQPNSSGPTYQMPTYLTHHDYALPPSMAPAGSQQRLALYQDSQAAMTNQPGSYSPAPPPMGSPAPTQRLTHMNVQTPNVISNQRPVVSGAGSYAQNNPNELLQSPENVQSNYEAVTQVQQGLQPTQMNSGSQVNTQRLQDFTYHQSSPNPAAAEAPPLSHYSQSNQSLQLNQSYMTSGQQNLQPSLTTQTSTTGLISVGAASQGNFQTFTKHNLSTNKTQTSVLSSTGGFQTDGGQMANSMSNANIAANQQSLTIPVGQQFRVVSGNTCGLSNATLIVNSSMAGLSSGVGAPMATSNAGQLQQPIVLQTNQQNVSLQIQQLQQQIQQLYNMQQNPQTQQKMLDLQEQVRSLAAQQQLQQQQRQKQQFFQQRPQPATIRLQQPSGLQGQVVTAIRLQPNKVAQQTRMQLPQQSLDASQQKQHHVVPVQHQTPQKHQLQTVQVQPKQVVQLQQAQVVQVQPKQQTQLLQLQQAKQQTQVVQLQQQVQATPQQSPKTVQARQVVQVQATPQQGQKSAPQTVRIVQANIQQKIQQPQQIKQISILSTPPTLPVTVSKAEQRPPVSTHVLVSLPQLVSSTASQHQQSQSQSLPQLQPSVSVQQARSQALPQLQPNVSVQQARSQPLPQLQPSVSVQQSQPQLKTSQPQLVTLRTLQPAKPGQTQQSQQIQQIIIIQQPNQQQQQVRIANAQVQGDQIQTLAPVASAATVVTTTTAADSSSRKEKRKGKGAHLQDKANKIIAEAIAKAEAEGREVPKVLPGASPADGSVEGDADEKPKKKKKKPKEKKPKEVKEKKPRPVVRPKSIKKKKAERALRYPGSDARVIPTFLKKRKRKDSADSAEGEVPGGSSVLDDDLIQKRRSSRNTKRKKYLDELDLDLSEDENKEVDIEGVTEAMVGKPGQFFVENPKEEDALIVEKVLGMRTGKRTRLKQVTPSKIEPDEDKQIDVEEDEGAAEEEASKMLKQKPEDTVVEEVEEFYVKYKNFSYLHCDWKTLPELELGDKRVQMKIRRFKQKRPTHFLFSQADDEDYFNADYIEVDRVLDESTGEDPVSGEVITYYLVKWQCLPYEDSTWEVAQDVDTMKIEAFERFKEPPPEDEREMIARPSSKEWTKIEESPIYKMGNKLREYQLEGVSWLTFCYYNKQNCILADEMGLGKTIQSIAFLHEVYDYGIHGPFLVIAPLSTIPNWQREFESWTDMNVVVYHGTTPSRNMIAEYEMYYKDDTGMRIPDVCKYTVLITTYEIIISDCEHLSQIEWRVAVIDEAHRLKNRNCKLLEGLKLFDLEHRVLLTGTPLQNNVEELFSLLNFLEPRQFSSSESFMTEFGDLKSETQVDKLKAILKPMMLRRLKEDVEKSLAPKEETIIEVELTNIQKKYYRAILEKNFQFLAKGGTTTNVPNLMNTMMELRKCCNHPYLITGAEEKILEETRCAHGNDPIKMFMAMVQSSGKLVLIDKLLPKLKAGQHKVLVFSQMIRVLDIIEDYLIHNHYLYERLDGRIRGNLRQEAIDRFSRPDSDRFVFLLCTRAGGLGINLTAADTVIIYDSDWNPQNDLQAQARCHRIGQSKAVKVYRLITRNSYEREMFDKASMKLGLDKAVLQSMGSKEVNPTNQLSKREIEDLLKKGAYGAIMDDNKDGDQFCEEDIDQILKRRTQVIQIEAGEKGSTFAKASFSVSGNRSDINIDDPNFWQKWAKKAELDMDDLSRNELVIEEPRQRKQTARYGNQDSILDMSELETSGSDEDFDDGALPLGRKGKKGRKGRRGRRRREEEDVGEQEDGPFDVYLRSDCFKVEKHLLVYGWGRWLDILRHGRFKRRLLETDVETISRAMLMFSLRHYAGDERIKEFICDLINPSEDGRAQKFKNHSGLAAPVPRGRKGRKAQKEKETSHVAETLANFGLDPDTVLRDEGYKKHLKRHANKVLLRVRLLYYLRQEVIGNQASKVFSGAPINEIDIPPPTADGDVPMYWWDSEADRSLLIGVFKHGYEKYNMVRGDPCLCFLSRCGPPDGSAMLAEQNDDEDIKDDDDDADIKPKKRKRKNLDDDDDELSPGSPQCDPPPAVPPTQQIIAENGKLPFPAPSDLNTRLRRVITGYQRSHKKRQQKQEQRAKKMEKRERFEAVIREREKMKKDAQQRWSRREETDFYRVVSTFGVEREPHTRKYRWDTFRSIARLERKYDDTLLEYFNAFYHMCKRVGRKITNESEMQPPNNLQVELITEERANRCLARIDLLCKIREEILWDPKLEERLKLCQSSLDMPEWWIPGVHDKDLLIGAAKHGLARTDYHILYDPKLAFREIVNAQASQAYPPNIPGAFPLMTGESTVGEESIGKNPFKEDDEASQDSLTSSKIESASEPAKDFPDSVKTENENSGEEIKSEEKVDDKQTDRDLAEAKDNMELPKPESPVKGSPVKESNQSAAVEESPVKMESPAKTEPKEELDTEDDTDEFGMSTPSRKPSFFQNMDLVNQSTPQEGNYMDDEGNYGLPPEFLGRSWTNPLVEWPKDRVVFTRLEHVCHCIQTGEWPIQRRYVKEGPGSRSDTPQGTPNMKQGTPMGAYDHAYVGNPDGSADGLKLTFQKKKRRKHKGEFDAVAELREMSYISQSDAESESNLSNFQDGEGGDFSPQAPGLLDRKEGDPPEKKRRGRKKKLDKLLEEAMAAQIRKQQMVFAALEPDARIPVVNIEDGSRLSGEEAPMKKDLPQWLEEHPGYMVERQEADDDIGEPDEQKKGRRKRVNPATLDLEKLTGDENVAVINRETGKRIAGAKAPPIKLLRQWLEKNPAFDVDAKWAHVVKAKANLPEEMQSRVLVPSGRRGRRPANYSSLATDYLNSAAQLNAYAGLNSLYAAYPKLPMGMTAFGGLGGLGGMGLANPMYAASLASMGYFSGLTKPNQQDSEERAESQGSDKEESSTPSKEKESAGEASSSSVATTSSVSASLPHPSFAYMYNPMMYSQLYAQSLAAANFTLPPSVPTSFASLAQSHNRTQNGMPADSDDAEENIDDRKESVAQDLSVKKIESGDDKSGFSTKTKSSSDNVEAEAIEAEAMDLSVPSRTKTELEEETLERSDSPDLADVMDSDDDDLSDEES